MTSNIVDNDTERTESVFMIMESALHAIVHYYNFLKWKSLTSVPNNHTFRMQETKETSVYSFIMKPGYYLSNSALQKETLTNKKQK